MTVREIRHANLVRLIGEIGNQRKFADRTGLAAAHVSQMNNCIRYMGDAVARKIEASLNKPKGWMDIDHSGQYSNPYIERIAEVFDDLPEGIQREVVEYAKFRKLNSSEDVNHRVKR